MLIAITGADGVGKSTVSSMLATLLNQQDVTMKSLDRWDVCSAEKFPWCRFIGMPKEQLRHCVADMPAHSRLMFIFWTLYTVIEEYRQDSSPITFIDSYWMKHAAAEVAMGLPGLWVEQLAAEFPKPDLTILLDVPPEEAWRRKEQSDFIDLNRYECGMVEQTSKESFIQHQQKLREVLQSWAIKKNWAVVNTHCSVDAVSQQVIKVLQQKNLITSGEMV